MAGLKRKPEPDLIFISTGSLDIVTDRVWGAPDLVVEVHFDMSLDDIFGER